MSSASDKARFFLERSAAELTELERKKIFTTEEISTISRKRSDFEHIVNARGSQPTDYIRYIDYEKNVDALRRKRVHRLGVKRGGGNNGARRIFFLYQRAVRKFPGDLGLWLQYINFARTQKSYKKLNEIFTAVVRLHPTKPDLWMYAAKFYMDTEADVTSARSYMQRGLRFCKSSPALWLEYAKLETIYIGKIAGRRKILGLDEDRPRTKISRDFGADEIALPDVTAEDINPNLKNDEVDEEALQNMAAAPILTGSIPIAIFDAAMKQFSSDGLLAEQFFHMFAEFDQLPCIRRILQHVLDTIQQSSSESPHVTACSFQMLLLGVHPMSPDFPPALRKALDSLNSAIQQHPESKEHLSRAAVNVLLPIKQVVDESADPVLKKVLKSSLRKYTRKSTEST